jgi:hypothetical protein
MQTLTLDRIDIIDLASSGLMDPEKPVFLHCDVQQRVSQGLDQGKSIPGTGTGNDDHNHVISIPWRPGGADTGRTIVH